MSRFPSLLDHILSDGALWDENDALHAGRMAPGKVTLTSRLSTPKAAVPPTRAQRVASPLRGVVPMGRTHPTVGENPNPPTGTQTQQVPDEFGGIFERSGAGGPGPDAVVDEPPAPGTGPSVSQTLPEGTRGRMEQAFGRGFSDVRVHRESERVSGSQQALTEGRDVHFAPGRYRPGTSDGDWLIGHELAHVVQQSGGPARAQAFDRASPTRGALETEADLAADAALAGRQAHVQLRVASGSPQAFDASEERAPAIDDAREAGEPDGESADDSASADVEDMQAEEEAFDPQAELATIAREGVGSVESSGGGGAPGGGGEPVADVVPQVSASEPDVAVAQLSGARPDRIVDTLPQVTGLVTEAVATKRDELAQNPPEMQSTGESVDVATGDPESKSGRRTHPAGAVEARADDPGTGSAGDAMADDGVGRESEARAPDSATGAGRANHDQSGEGAATDRANTSGEAPARAPVTPPTAQATSGTQDQGEAPAGVSAAEVRNLGRIVDSLPADASGLNTDAGPPPAVELTGEANPQTAQNARANLDQDIEARAHGERGEIARPMGEDDIQVSRPTEMLSAELSAGASDAQTAVGPALQVDMNARGEAIGIIAQQERGAEIDGAIAQAKADMAAERQRHEQEDAQRRAQADEEIASLKRGAEDEQARARQQAQADVDTARTEWQGELDGRCAEARQRADAELQAGVQTVEAEQQRADAESARHIADGEAEARAEQQKADTEVKAKQREADEKKKGGGGVMGWIRSKVKSFFEGIKKAISAAIDLARKAIKVAIEAAKKLAMEIIERARQAIVAAIKAVGEALMAIGDALLAAFPELREKFRQRIQQLVDGATAAVNAIADKLKEGVKKALDALGAALDAALGLLEKGLHAIVDGVAAVVDGALAAAEALAQALGAFLVLAKDIATGPGAWLSALGASIMDGIQNHLWTAFQAAVSDWFQSKVVELLGVGGMVLEILQEGGIDLGQIGDMAWEAAQTAIPAALIAVLIEKLVSMIVPAAGAVMAVIEGLQAAWGTLSRIVAAFGAFIAFLKAVKSGKAGPQFAHMLAMAAVVVLDFVSNWLLKKLRKAVAKVGKKLKKMAKKMAKKRKKKKGQKDGDKKKKKKKDEDDDDNETKAQKEARLRKAAAEIERRIGDDMPAKKAKAVVKEVAAKHRVRGKLKKKGKRWKLSLKINPKLDRWFKGKDLEKVKKQIQDAGFTIASVERELTQMWQDKGGQRGPGDNSAADGAVAKATGGTKGFQGFLDNPENKLDKRQSDASKLGQEFEQRRRAQTRADTENRSDYFYLPGEEGEGQKGLDDLRIYIGQHGLPTEIMEYKRKGSKTLTTSSSKRLPENFNPKATLDKSGSISEHLEKKDLYEQVVNGEQIGKEGEDGQIRQVTNPYSAITKNLLKNLQKCQTRIEKIIDDKDTPKEVLAKAKQAREVMQKIIAGQQQLVIRVQSADTVSEAAQAQVRKLVATAAKKLEPDAKKAESLIEVTFERVEKEGETVSRE